MKINISPARTAAYKILFDVFENGAFSNIAINRHIDLSLKNPNDRKLAVHLVYGTIKKKNRLEAVLSGLSNIPIDKIHPSIRVILFFSLYQIIYMDKIPEYAIVNDAVNMCKFYGQPSAVSFVNAILRNALRQKASYSVRNSSDAMLVLDEEYGFPRWISEMLFSQYGAEKILKFAKASEDAPEVSIKVNILKTTEAILADSLAEKEIVTEKTIIPDSLFIKSSVNIFMTEEYRNGWFFAQDISGTICGYALDPQPGDRIIDLCSAPGGKSFHAGILSHNTDILSCDIVTKKLEIVKRSAWQLGLSGIRAVKRDAVVMRAEEKELYDRVICDVPCSGLGVIRRKPEILYRLNEDHMADLTALQSKIIANALDYLKPGGTMIYSTCTINRLENSEIVRKALAKRQDAELVPITLPFQLPVNHPELSDGMLQLWTDTDGCDGFFMAKIRKKSV